MCPVCRESLTALARPDGRLGRVVRATVFGMIGGALGAAAWYAVSALFNYQLGLIAILVGWLVGTGVSRGSGGRGGLGYQLLAAFIAYASIVTTYIPDIIDQIRKLPRNEAVESANAKETATSGGSRLVAASPTATPDPTPTATPDPTPARVNADEPPSLLGGIAALGLGVLAIYAIAFAAPFLMGIENAIGILIIFFALHQAWTLNRKTILDIQGPFRVSTPPEGTTPSTTP